VVGDRDRYRHNPNWRNDRRYDWRSWRNSADFRTLSFIAAS